MPQQGSGTLGSHSGRAEAPRHDHFEPATKLGVTTGFLCSCPMHSNPGEQIELFHLDLESGASTLVAVEQHQIGSGPHRRCQDQARDATAAPQVESTGRGEPDGLGEGQTVIPGSLDALGPEEVSVALATQRSLDAKTPALETVARGGRRQREGDRSVRQDDHPAPGLGALRGGVHALERVDRVVDDLAIRR